MTDLMQRVPAPGFPLPERVTILLGGGSELHGAKMNGTEDLEMSFLRNASSRDAVDLVESCP